MLLPHVRYQNNHELLLINTITTISNHTTVKRDEKARKEAELRATIPTNIGD